MIKLEVYDDSQLIVNRLTELDKQKESAIDYRGKKALYGNGDVIYVKHKFEAIVAQEFDEIHINCDVDEWLLNKFWVRQSRNGKVYKLGERVQL